MIHNDELPKPDIIGLSEQKSTIPIPLPKHIPHINSNKVSAWIQESDNERRMRAIKEKVLTNLQHIDFNEFKRNLDISINSLNEVLEKDTLPYWVLFDATPHKSRRWVYHLSERDLTRKPTVATYFEVINEELNRKIMQRAIEQDIRSFVIIDDASYGGSQIGYNIEAITKFYQEMGQDCPQFLLCVPYVTNRARTNISQIEGARVAWLNNQVMPSLQEQLSEEELEYVLKHHFQFTPYGYYKPQSFDDVITLFDHCIPDMRSFDMQINNFIDRSGFTKPYADSNQLYYQYEEGEYKNFYYPIKHNANFFVKSALDVFTLEKLPIAFLYQM